MDRLLDDHIAMQDYPDKNENILEVTENICRFYEEVAYKLYDLREKMKKLIKTRAKYSSVGSYEDFQKKIQAKAEVILNEKMALYIKIKEIEDIL